MSVDVATGPVAVLLFLLLFFFLFLRFLSPWPHLWAPREATYPESPSFPMNLGGGF